jgi:hypothetical protein
MVDDAAYFGRDATARAIVGYDNAILSAVSKPTFAVAALIILSLGSSGALRLSP